MGGRSITRSREQAAKSLAPAGQSLQEKSKHDFCHLEHRRKSLDVSRPRSSEASGSETFLESASDKRSAMVRRVSSQGKRQKSW